ncbi:MAG: hypothetical protein AB1689_14390 [Thermodesulfobacteriota bacterium]
MKLRRRLLATGTALALLACVATPARAQGQYDDGQAHPLRVVAYLVAPAGFLAEWLVTRPLFRLVSQDDTAPIFAYTPQGGFDYETYEEGLSTGVTFESPYKVMQQQGSPP